MKVVMFSLLCLLVAVPGHSQLLLNAGNSYTFEFSSLPFSVTQPADDPFKYPASGWFNVVTAVPVGPLVQYRLDLFENSLLQAPVGSALYDRSVAENATLCSAAGAWRDLQGAIRITALAGSFQIDEIAIGSALPQTDGSVNVYARQFTPVPEPTTIALCGVALLAAAIRWRHRLIPFC